MTLTAASILALETTDLRELFALPAIQRSGMALVIAALFLPVVGVLIIGFDILTVFGEPAFESLFESLEKYLNNVVAVERAAAEQARLTELTR